MRRFYKNAKSVSRREELINSPHTNVIESGQMPVLPAMGNQQDDSDLS